ncbi:AAA family ATPase [Cellulomonas sp. C5510]|nr:AAA family ATPase [Cellulomonas sp. C5510]
MRLVRPVLADVPPPVRLGADQRAVVERLLAREDRALLVVGAAGTGKTLLAVEAVAAALGADDDALLPSPGTPSPDEVLVLASGRRAAAELRDRIGARVRRTTGQAMVRTAASAAFAVLRSRAALLGEPAPTLISGPEQDLALAELLAGHAAGEGVPLRWPAGVPDDALTLRAFRGELRDLLMRAAERGVGPVELAALGDRHGRPEWVAAATLYAEYLDVTTLRAGTPDAGARHDPATVVEEAAEALRAWDQELPGRPRPRWRLVVVDDYQEATEATARLLRVLQDDGATVLLLADPDEAVQTFRGATPALVGRADAHGDGPGELGAHRMVLETVRRHGPALRQVAGRVSQRVAVVGGAAHRRARPASLPGAVGPGRGGGTEAGAGVPRAGGGPDAPRDLVRTAVLPSAAQEAAWIAHALRRAHLEDGTPWAEMAVVTRSGAQVTALRRALGSASVPVAVVGSDVPLRDEPAVRPLLDALRCVLGGDRPGGGVGAGGLPTPAPPGRLSTPGEPRPWTVSRRGSRHRTGRPPAGSRSTRRSPRACAARRWAAWTPWACGGCGVRCARRRSARGAAGRATTCWSRRSRSPGGRPRCRRPCAARSSGSPACWPPAARPPPTRAPTRRPSCGRSGRPPGSRTRGAGRRSQADRAVRERTGTWTRSSRCSGPPRPSWTGCRRPVPPRSSSGWRRRSCRPTPSRRGPAGTRWPC